MSSFGPSDIVAGLRLALKIYASSRSPVGGDEREQEARESQNMDRCMVNEEPASPQIVRDLQDQSGAASARQNQTRESDSIRLLKLAPGATNPEMCVNLLDVSLNNPAEYVNLSYTWGNVPTSTLDQMSTSSPQTRNDYEHTGSPLVPAISASNREHAGCDGQRGSAEPCYVGYVLSRVDAGRHAWARCGTRKQTVKDLCGRQEKAHGDDAVHTTWQDRDPQVEHAPTWIGDATGDQVDHQEPRLDLENIDRGRTSPQLDLIHGRCRNECTCLLSRNHGEDGLDSGNLTGINARRRDSTNDDRIICADGGGGVVDFTEFGDLGLTSVSAITKSLGKHQEEHDYPFHLRKRLDESARWYEPFNTGPALRLLLKAACIITSASANVIIRNFALQANLVRYVPLPNFIAFTGGIEFWIGFHSSSSWHRHTVNVCHRITRLYLDADWARYPTPLTFFAAAMMTGCLMTTYSQLCANDRGQAWFILLGVVICFIIGHFTELSLAASVLCDLPLCVLSGLVLSDMAHGLARICNRLLRAHARRASTDWTDEKKVEAGDADGVLSYGEDATTSS